MTQISLVCRSLLRFPENSSASDQAKELITGLLTDTPPDSTTDALSGIVLWKQQRELAEDGGLDWTSCIQVSEWEAARPSRH